MITPRRIQKLARSGDDDALLDAVLANGRPLPIEARLRLAEPDSIGAAAVALGLQRAVELAAGASPECLDLLDRLLVMQRAAGDFGSVSATAAAVRAIDMLLQCPGLPEDSAAAGAEALDRAVHAMHCAITLPLIGGAPTEMDDLDRAIALWQLADLAKWRRQLHLDAVERDLADRPMIGDAARRVLALAGAIAPARRAA